MTPTTEYAKRIAALFRRRLTTNWSEKEIRQYKKLVKDGYFIEDLELVERYYVFERRKGDMGIHRRDLQTFLNNYPGEVDRAKLWDLRFRRPRRQLKPNPNQPVSDNEFKRIGELAREQLEEFRKQLRHEQRTTAE